MAVDAVRVAVGADVSGVEGRLLRGVMLHEGPGGVVRLCPPLLEGLSEVV